MTTRDLLYPACCALAAASCSDGDWRDVGLIDGKCRQLASQLEMIMDSRGDTVFDTLPEGTPCTLQLRSVPYQPSETRAFEFKWTQARRDDGSQVPAGPYTIDARERSVECRGALDASAAFVIQ
jgi:hypothetical protein